MSPAHTLYLLALVRLDDPDAGWVATAGSELSNVAGDRLLITPRFRGFTLVRANADGTAINGGFAERLDEPWRRIREGGAK